MKSVEATSCLTWHPLAFRLFILTNVRGKSFIISPVFVTQAASALLHTAIKALQVEMVAATPNVFSENLVTLFLSLQGASFRAVDSSVNLDAGPMGTYMQ